jgi:hypothetical protein
MRPPLSPTVPEQGQEGRRWRWPNSSEGVEPLLREPGTGVAHMVRAGDSLLLRMPAMIVAKSHAPTRRIARGSRSVIRKHSELRGNRLDGGRGGQIPSCLDRPV